MQIKLNWNPRNFTPTYVRKIFITTNIGPLHLENGKVTNSEIEIAEVLEDYFESVFIVGDTNKIEEITPAQPNLISLSDCEFTEDAETKALDITNVGYEGT